MSDLSSKGPRTAIITVRPHKLTPLPASGSYVRSPSGKSVYRVIDARKLRTAGTKQEEPRFRLVCVRARAAEIPPGVHIAPWPAALPRPSRKPGVKVPERQVPSVGAIRRAKVEAHRAARERVLAGSAEGDPIVPAALGATIVGPGGDVLRGPLIGDGEWWDPEDLNRTTRHRKVVRGKRRVDPIERLAAHNSGIKREHILATDLYRQAYEQQARSLRGWHLDEFSSGGGFGPSSGPSDALCIAARKWSELQEYVGDAKARHALEYIVLERNSVGSWAEKAGMSQRGEGVGYLIALLDRLVECKHFKHEIEQMARKLEDLT